MQISVTAVLLMFHISVLLMFAFCTEYPVPDAPRVSYTTGIYNMFQDIHVMIAVGFGFLMAFLHRKAFTTTGHSFLVMTFVILWAILNHGFWHRAVVPHISWDRIRIGIPEIINADFCAGAVLISFGAVVGRVSADQLLIMAFFEVVCYSINEAIASVKYQVADVGGTMVIHVFGAYFGLACSFVLEYGNPHRETTFERYKALNASSKTNDTFAMIGTLFLWCFWPSFNAALAGPMAEVAQVNTYLSIASSCLMTFYTISIIKKGKFRMVEIQNSTLAGGVAIGAMSNMHIEPFGAILMGSVAGILSVVGYQYVSDRLPVLDTCGVHNLHGMPGILGAIGSIVAARLTTSAYNWGTATTGDVFGRVQTNSVDARQLALFQFVTLATTLGFAIVGGALTGFVLRGLRFLHLNRYFSDTEEWADVEVDEYLAALDGTQHPQRVTSAPETEMAQQQSKVTHIIEEPKP